MLFHLRSPSNIKIGKLRAKRIPLDFFKLIAFFHADLS
jgi:hypothetical protein